MIVIQRMKISGSARKISQGNRPSSAEAAGVRTWVMLGWAFHTRPRRPAATAATERWMSLRRGNKRCRKTNNAAAVTTKRATNSAGQAASRQRGTQNGTSSTTNSSGNWCSATTVV